MDGIFSESGRRNDASPWYARFLSARSASLKRLVTTISGMEIPFFPGPISLSSTSGGFLIVPARIIAPNTRAIRGLINSTTVRALTAVMFCNCSACRWLISYAVISLSSNGAELSSLNAST